MNHQKSQNSHQKIMEALNLHFPHLNSLIINPQASLADSLENIISHINEPDQVNLLQVINKMKDAVDRQQLKIQKSLVNNEPLANMNNFEYNKRETNLHIKNIDFREIKQQLYQNQPLKNQDNDEIIQEIWRWDEEENRNKYWFKN